MRSLYRRWIGPVILPLVKRRSFAFRRRIMRSGVPDRRHIIQFWAGNYHDASNARASIGQKIPSVIPLTCYRRDGKMLRMRHAPDLTARELPRLYKYFPFGGLQQRDFMRIAQNRGGASESCLRVYTSHGKGNARRILTNPRRLNPRRTTVVTRILCPGQQHHLRDHPVDGWLVQ